MPSANKRTGNWRICGWRTGTFAVSLSPCWRGCLICILANSDMAKNTIPGGQKAEDLDNSKKGSIPEKYYSHNDGNKDKQKKKRPSDQHQYHRIHSIVCRCEDNHEEFLSVLTRPTQAQRPPTPASVKVLGTTLLVQKPLPFFADPLSEHSHQGARLTQWTWRAAVPRT